MEQALSVGRERSEDRERKEKAMAMTLSRKILVLVAAMVVGLMVVAVVPAQAQEQRLVYTGTSTMTVQLVDVFGQPAGVETYQNPIEVVVRGGQVSPDPNPFFLAAQSKPLVNDPGEVSILSAAGEVRYWTLQAHPDDTFNGVLTNTHASEARAANLITIPVEIAPNLWQPYTLAMATGTQMSGGVTVDRFEAQVKGNTTDQAHPFTITIEATRSG
jgi:hypothetical protein